MKQIIKHAFIKTLPVMAGYLVLGIGFGIIAEKSGYGVIWAMAMLVVYCFKDIYITHFPFGLSEIIAGTIVVLLHV